MFGRKKITSGVQQESKMKVENRGDLLDSLPK